MSIFIKDKHDYSKLATADEVNGAYPLAGINMLPASSMQNTSTDLLKACGWEGDFDPNKIQIDDSGLTLDSRNYDLTDISTVLSTDITPSTFYTFSLSIVWANNLNGDLFFVELDKNGISFDGPKYRDHQVHLVNSWDRKANTFTFETSDNPDLKQLRFYIRAYKGCTFKFKYLKLEYGKNATVWTPAGGDIEKTYEALKSQLGGVKPSYRLCYAASVKEVA